MNDELMEHRISKAEDKIDDHDNRIDKLERSGAEFKIQIENLCRSITQLTGLLKWVVGLLGGSLVTFFFYAIQNHIFG